MERAKDRGSWLRGDVVRAIVLPGSERRRWEELLLFSKCLKIVPYGALLVSLALGCADSGEGTQQSSNASSSFQSSSGAGAMPQPSAADAPDDESRSEPTRVVPLGDSITEGSCTSQLLWQALRERGVTSFDLVGTRYSDQDCGVPDADRDNEGHSGYLASQLVDDGPHAEELRQWSAADRGDVVLMHLGTNDIWRRALPPEAILAALSKILETLRAVQPKVVVFVAQIIAMNPKDCSECAARVPKLNQAIPDWAARESQPGSPVYVVDQWTGFDVASDTRDGVHPNKQGAQKMADKWAAALLARQIL